MGASPTGNGSVQSAHQGRREPGQWGVQVQRRVVGLQVQVQMLGVGFSREVTQSLRDAFLINFCLIFYIYFLHMYLFYSLYIVL